VVGDGDAILKRLVQGHDIHRSALLEEPLPEPLPQESALPGAAATIQRFEPNWLQVEVEAGRTPCCAGRSVYPGWRAEIDGQVRACVPANLWMRPSRCQRAAPGPSYFHQDYLLPGLLISLASAGLLLAVMAWRRAVCQTQDVLQPRVVKAVGKGEKQERQQQTEADCGNITRRRPFTAAVQAPPIQTARRSGCFCRWARTSRCKLGKPR